MTDDGKAGTFFIGECSSDIFSVQVKSGECYIRVGGGIVIRDGKIVWKHGPYLAEFDINLKYR